MEATVHRWKLGPETWVHILVWGRLTARRIAVLKRYLDLVEPDPELDAVTGLDGDGI